MMRSAIFGLLSLGFLFAGCATSSQPVTTTYDSTSNRTTYETGEMRLNGLELTSGLQKRNRFYMQVVGRCKGEDCVPSSYDLHFVKRGPQPVNLEARTLSLTVGTETLKWNDPQTREVTQTSTVRSGTFAKVDVSGRQLSTIGNVSNVSGSVGGNSFSISHENRAPIRSLLSRLEQVPADSVGARS